MNNSVGMKDIVEEQYVNHEKMINKLLNIPDGTQTLRTAGGASSSGGSASSGLDVYNAGGGAKSTMLGSLY